MFYLYTSSKLSSSQFEFLLKVKGSNPGYLLKSFLLYLYNQKIYFKISYFFYLCYFALNSQGNFFSQQHMYLLIFVSFSFNRSEKRFEDFAICTFASDSQRKMCETAYQVSTRRNNFLNGLCGLLEREKRHLSGKVSEKVKHICFLILLSHSNVIFFSYKQAIPIQLFDKSL